MIKKFLEEVGKETNINFTIRANGNNTEKYGYDIEGEYWSDLGEDVLIYFNIEEPTIEEILNGISNYVDDFDPEQHAVELYNMHGKYGTPTSLRALLEDADKQAEKLELIYTVMQRLKERMD